MKPTWAVMLPIALILVLTGCQEKKDDTKSEPSKLKLGIDFVVNPGAEAEDKDLDEALKKINEQLSKAGIELTKSTISRPEKSSVPVTPKHGKPDTADKEQSDAAKEAEGVVAKLKAHGQVTVKVVKNFQSPDFKTEKSTVNGISVNGTIVIADPFHVGQNTNGGEEFWHTLWHELYHSLTRKLHKVLDSDKNYEHQKNGEYTPPNFMAPEAAKGDTDMTEDQGKAMKEAVEKLLKK